jgi:hypothetical protein
VGFREVERRWLKFTKWNSAGYTVDLETGEPLFLPATPRVYLERLRLQNEFFGDDWQFLGIQADGPNLRLVTSQPDVVGEAPSVEELDHHLREQFGFRRLNIPPMGYHKSRSYLLDNLGLFDVHPANAVMTPGGTLVPIDFILVKFDRTEQARLEARIEA